MIDVHEGIVVKFNDRISLRGNTIVLAANQHYVALSHCLPTRPEELVSSYEFLDIRHVLEHLYSMFSRWRESVK